jgi:hypothetical protein
VNAACLAYHSRGVGVFNPQLRSASALFIQASLPSIVRAPVGFTTTFTPSLIATWLFAPYDSWTSHTLFDRRHLNFTTTHYLFFTRCKPSRINNRKPSQETKQPATLRNLLEPSACTQITRRIPCDFRYHKYNPELRPSCTTECTHPDATSQSTA